MTFDAAPAPVAPDVATAETAGARRVPPPAAGAFLTWFSGLSTSTKLLLWMVLTLAPLGLIAVLASIESARASQANRLAGARAVAVETARSIDVLLSRTEATLRGAGTALERAGPGRCRQTLDRLASSNALPVALALFRPDGSPLCWTGTSPRSFLPLPRPEDGPVIAADGSTLSIATPTLAGRLTGIARFDAAVIDATGHPRLRDGSYALSIEKNGRTMLLERTRGNPRPPIVVPMSGGLRLALGLAPQRMTASEIAGIVLPVAMLLCAAGIAFLVIDRLMLRPLKQLQTAVVAYRAGDRRLELAPMTTPAREIRLLADSFRSVAATIARHEEELEAGLSRQTRLTREVHHRVKNNLQVVASLLSLQARRARSTEVAEAYAAIQRRVDALAIVHRNHFAELEENRGVGLRALIAELATNLRGGAPASAANMPILLDVSPLYANQDIAVPVAFLVTELVEAAMLNAPDAGVAIRLMPTTTAGRAMLSIVAPGAAAALSAVDRDARRVIEGLSRQLRSVPVEDGEEGCFAIEIAVVD